jgi:hypothetical protein
MTEFTAGKDRRTFLRGVALSRGKFWELGFTGKEVAREDESHHGPDRPLIKWVHTPPPSADSWGVPFVPWSPLRICLQWSCWLTPVAKTKGSLSVVRVLLLISGYVLGGEAHWTAPWQRGDRS